MSVMIKKILQVILLAAICFSFGIPTGQAGAAAAQADYIPTLLTPADSSRVQTTRPAFTWTEVAGATGYKLKISTSPDFIGWAYEFNLKTTEYEPTFDFPDEKTIYWKVKPIGIIPSVYSDAFTFQSASPTVAPEMDRPVDGDYVSSLTPILRWQAVEHAVEYRLQLASDPDFTMQMTETSSVSTLYLIEQPLQYNQTWYWRVRAADADGDLSKWSPTRSFHTGMASPALIEPVDGAVIHTTRPTFTWEAVKGATSYQLFVSLDGTFSEGTRSWSLTETSFTPREDLYRGYTLYWRVIAVGEGTSASPTFEFESADPPSTPVLISPANSALLSTNTPRLVWSRVNRASHYEVEIATTPNFTGDVQQFSTPDADNEFTIPLENQIPPNSMIYWRVRSVSDNDDQSAWTKPLLFRTPNATPSIVTPPNGTTVDSPTPLFKWLPVTGAESYTVQISTSPTFDVATINLKSEQTEVQVSRPLAANTTYFWRVRANGVNPGLWSENQTLTTR